MHHRFSPKRHRFSYRLFLFALDLDELDTLDRSLRLFSVGRRNLYSFRDDDFLPVKGSGAGGGTLRERVGGYLKAHGIDLGSGRVELLTMPRMFGYLFNPVSFYFCYDDEGRALATIAEVTNTFREVKPFLLGPDACEDHVFRRRVPKHFYVSPYSDVDVAFDFAIPPPGERLGIRIDDYDGQNRTLTSTLTGRAVPLTNGSLAWQTLRHPLVSLRVITLIHWEALRLFLKRVPWFAKASRSEDQRGVLRPHVSLQRAAAHKT